MDRERPAAFRGGGGRETGFRGNNVYVFGGEIGHDTLHLQQYEVDIYNPVTDKWTRGADMPVARRVEHLRHRQRKNRHRQFDDYKANNQTYIGIWP